MKNRIATTNTAAAAMSPSAPAPAAAESPPIRSFSRILAMRGLLHVRRVITNRPDHRDRSKRDARRERACHRVAPPSGRTIGIGEPHESLAQPRIATGRLREQLLRRDLELGRE